MTSYLQGAVALAARVLLSQIFLLASVNHLLHWGSIVQSMTDKGMSLESVFGRMGGVFVNFLHVGAVAFLIVGGLSVLLGIRARFGAVLLILFLIPVTLTFHDYWHYAPGTERIAQMTNFMKNMGLAGGLLMVLAFGSGPLSLKPFWPWRQAKPAVVEEM
jgi:putative oxidoreductase